MYKEFRDTTLAGAVSQMCKLFLKCNERSDQEMSGRHRAPHESIQIVKTSIVPAKDAKRDHAIVFSRVNVKFPKVKSLKRAPNKSLKTTFKASRPIVF